MEKIIELEEDDELILVNSKTKKGTWKIIYQNGNVQLQKCSQNIKEYYKIQDIEANTLKCYGYLNDIINNSKSTDFDNHTWQEFNKIYDIFYYKIFGHSTDDIISQNFQCITKYESF